MTLPRGHDEAPGDRDAAIARAVTTWAAVDVLAEGADEWNALSAATSWPSDVRAAEIADVSAALVAHLAQQVTALAGLDLADVLDTARLALLRREGTTTP